MKEWFFCTISKRVTSFGFLHKLLNIIELKEDKIILPIKKDEKISLKKAEKLANKTKKILERTASKKIVLSKEIKKQEQYKNFLEENLKIVNGKFLEEILILEIIEYIIEKKKYDKENLAISFLVNDIGENTLKNFKKAIKKYKKVNIVTNHLEKLKKIEEKFLEEGIIVLASNNKKKSLAKSDIIINVDFPSELLNKYRVNDNATIVNIKLNAKIDKKRFNGLIINNYEITYNPKEEFDYDKMHLYDKKDIYESIIYKNMPYKVIEEKIKQDNVKITSLMGNREVI